MKMSRITALGLMVLLLAMLLFGTQMPGAWRDGAVNAAHMPWQITKVAHVMLFASMAFLARVVPLRWSVATVFFAALALALLTEALQHFAANREPSWFDVGIDLAGAVLGMMTAWGFTSTRRILAS